MADDLDPVQLADVLLIRTNAILQRLEREREKFVTKPSNGFATLNREEKEKRRKEICEELGVTENNTRRSENYKNEKETEQSFFQRNNPGGSSAPDLRASVSSIPPTKRMDSDENITSPNHKIMTKSAVECRKHGKNLWKQELTRKIMSLEQELEQMKLLHAQNNATLPINLRRTESEFFLDIVSSQSSSPIKHASKEMGITFRKPTTFTTNRVSSGAKNSVSLGRTFRTCMKNEESDVENVKQRLIETEVIMDRGFKTARQLNRQLERLKQEKTQVVKKDVALQVVPEAEASTPSEHDSYICGLAENLTTLLIEKEKADEQVTTCRSTNTRHLVVKEKEKPRSKNLQNQRLAVQRLPDNFIKDALIIQPLPSIHIPSFTVDKARTPQNIKIFDMRHASESPNLITESIEQQSVEKNREPTPKARRRDASVQAQTSKAIIPIEKQVDALSKTYKRESEKLVNKFSDNNNLVELLKKVRESREKFQPLIQETKALNPNPPANTPDRQTDKESAVKVSSSTITEVEELEDYKSDFEVSSLDLDEKESISKNVSISRNESPPKSEKIKKGKFLVTVVPESALTNQVKPRQSSKSDWLPESALTNQAKPRKGSKADWLPELKSPTNSSSSSKDESLIEEQMKRLGLSGDRPRSSRRSPNKLPSSREGNKSKSLENEHYQLAVPESQTLYLKSDGKFIPIDPLQAPKVQIIVPEIVVKLADSSSAHRLASPASTSKVVSNKPTQDQVIQTDEGCGTLTSGDASSIVEKLNRHFERTQLLIERMGTRSTDIMGVRLPGQKNDYLHRLHRRGSETGQNGQSSRRRIKVWDRGSPGEQTSEKVRHVANVASRQRMDIKTKDPIEDCAASQSQSIGEVSRQG